MAGLRIGRPPQPLRNKFFHRFLVGCAGGCWMWTGTVSNGYGAIKDRGKTLKASRVSWELHRGPIPNGLFVCHACDVPLCVNPNHLFLGTCQDNIDDRTRKGRGPRQDGARNHQAKLTAEKVLAIREATGTHKQIAARFGICRQNVGLIRNMKTWSRM